MCKKAKQQSRVLEDRTKGLDSRGNQAMNTQAESSWATETLKSLRDNPEASKLLTDELMRVYDDSKMVKGAFDKRCVAKFQKGFEEYFGKYEENPKTQQTRRTNPANAQPQPEDLMNLMLEGKYDFKEAVDALVRTATKTEAGRALYKQGRDNVPEFSNRGRKEGRLRKDSFIGPHAGITDQVFRTEGSENFFSREVLHAKGALVGDPASDTYKKFVKQGAPFIGGVSGTIQGIAMCMEFKQKLDEIDDSDEKKAEIERREKTVALHMAALVAGGHHSMAETLFAAQRHGLFAHITNPLENYPKAMKELGDHFKGLGLPGGLTPEGGAAWNKALTRAKDDIGKVRKEIAVLYGNDRERLNAFNAVFVQGFAQVFPDDLATSLNELVALVDDTDQQRRIAKKQETKRLIDKTRTALTGTLVSGIEENPFITVRFRTPLSDALNQVSSLTN